MEDLLNFYLNLAKNNNKVWFDSHRAEYENAKKILHSIAKEFISGIEKFDPRCRGLEIKDCIYRINRDIRFSADKSPYKHWTGIYVCPKGKKSGMAGYYIHLEPVSNLYFVCAGLYNPTKEVIQSVREQIMLQGEEFHNAVQQCGDDFSLNWESALKRLPAGFNAEDIHSEYYRLKSYETVKYLSKKEVLSKKFISNALSYLKRCYGYNEMLNNCFDYAFDPERD